MADGFSRPTFKYFNSHNTSGAQTVKSQPGILRTVSVNTPAAGTITVQDGSNTMALITVVAGSPYALIFDQGFNTSLSINPSVATMDITVSYQ